MMKFITAVFLTFVFSNQALACWTTKPEAEAKLISMFQIDGEPVDWVSIKKKKKKRTISINRSFPVTVLATDRINSSKIIYKRDTYDLENAKVCFHGKNISIYHPEGELVVGRKGTTIKNSVITLREENGFFKLKLRPTDFFDGKTAVTY